MFNDGGSAIQDSAKSFKNGQNLHLKYLHSKNTVTRQMVEHLRIALINLTVAVGNPRFDTGEQKQNLKHCLSEAYSKAVDECPSQAMPMECKSLPRCNTYY